MKRWFLSTWAAVVISCFAFGEGGTSTPRGFTDDYEAALKRAQEKGKLVYIVFSGSDWCGGCQGLERQLLSKSEFVDGVKENWELVFIDVPKDTSRLSPLGRQQNGKVRSKFGVNRFPTVYVLDPTGTKIANGESGVGSTLPEIVKRMNKFKVNYFKKQQLNERIGDEKPGTRARAQAIHQYLQTLSFEDQCGERELIQEVLDVDKKQTLGLKGAYFYFSDIEPVAQRLQDVMTRYLTAEDKARHVAAVKKELTRLESKVRAMKPPRGNPTGDNQKKELLEAIREALGMLKKQS